MIDRNPPFTHDSPEFFEYMNKMFNQSQIPTSWESGFNLAKNAILHNENNEKNNFNVGAALFSGNKAISIGYNIYQKSHPLYVDTEDNGEEFCKSTHAELMALARRKHYDNRNLILYVYRETKAGVPATSEPCSICKKIIKEFNVKKVRYINKEGMFVEEKPKNWIV